MTVVIKKRGTVESFDQDKIKRSIQKAAIDAGYSLNEKEDLINEITDHVTEKVKEENEVKSDVICEAVLNEMLASSPEIVDAWRKFDRRYKF
jgi:transcriptional repressor NrdR